MKSFIALCACLIVVMSSTFTNAQSPGRPETLRRMASDYYDWRNQNYPVSSSDAGLHAWDNKLTDYSPAAIAARRAHVVSLLGQLNRMRTDRWQKDDQIDWLLFRAQREGPVFL